MSSTFCPLHRLWMDTSCQVWAASSSHACAFILPSGVIIIFFFERKSVEIIIDKLTWLKRTCRECNYFRSNHVKSAVLWGQKAQNPHQWWAERKRNRGKRAREKRRARKFLLFRVLERNLGVSEREKKPITPKKSKWTNFLVVPVFANPLRQ